ncbi:MAG: hypothetical protein ACI4UA_05105 [Bacteroidaceae bacterium]
MEKEENAHPQASSPHPGHKITKKPAQDLPVFKTKSKTEVYKRRRDPSQACPRLVHGSLLKMVPTHGGQKIYS